MTPVITQGEDTVSTALFVNTERVQVKVRKQWQGDAEHKALRPTFIVVHLYADGEELLTRVMNAERQGTADPDLWELTINNLPKYRDGKLIEYTVEEEPVTHYVTVSERDGYTTTLTNVYIETTADIEGVKSLVNRRTGETVAMEDGQFRVEISAVDPASPLPAETVADVAADGSFRFADIPFTLDDLGLTGDGDYQDTNTHTYLVREIIPETVNEIGVRAFEECKQLESVIIEAGIKELPFGIFWGCSSLKNVTLPQGLMTIEECAFNQCVKLESVLLPKTLTEIQAEVFIDCTSLRKLQIPENVSQIGSSAFHGCISLQDVTIPKSVKEISCTLFSNCSALRNINIPSSIERIGQSAFENCTSLKAITLSGDIKELGKYAFQNCTNLQKLIIDKTIGYIGDYCFLGCFSLKKIVFNSSSLPQSNFRKRAFDGVSTECAIIVPFGQKRLYKAIPVINKFNKIKEHFIF